MLKTVEDISTTKKRLKIEIPADTIEKEITDSLDRVRRTTTLPGFRTGKTPISLIEKKFGKKIEGEVLERMIPRVYIDALKEADITPVANPVLEEELDFKRHLPISMTFTVEIMPKVENLRYEGIKVKELPIVVDDSDIDTVLKRLREERTTYEVSEGLSEMDGLVVFDYSIKEDSFEIKDQAFKIGSGVFPEDFSQKLIGRKKGDELTIETTFPADHPLGKFAGRRLTFNVSIKDVKKAILPEIDDEFAKDIGFDNLSELRKQVGEDIRKAKENEAAKIQKAELINKLLESHEFDVPESLVENEALALASADMSRKQGTGKAQAKDKDIEKLRAELRPNAIKNVKASLLLDMIGKKEKITVTEDEVRNALAGMARRFSVSPENLMKFYTSRDGSLNGLKNSIFEDKALDLILSKAAIEKGE